MNFLTKWISQTFSTSSYPRPPGSYSGDGFERNYDNPLVDRNEHRILRLSAALACVRLTASTISTLPLNVYERMPNGARRLAPDYFLYDLLHNQPNDEMTAQNFWEAYVSSILLRGDAYGRKRYGSVGQVSAIDFMSPDRLTWQRNVNTGARVYTYIDRSGRAVTLGEDDVFHTVGYTLDGCQGLSPIEYGVSVFGSALQADRAANQTFRNGLMPTVGFKMEQILKGVQRKEFKDNFKREMAGALNAGKPFLLEGGMDAVAIGIKPSDAQLLESRAWSIEEICRWFGTPPPLVGHSTKTTSWPTGNEAQMMMWLTLGLRAHLTRIEQAVRKDLIPVRDRAKYYVEFSLEGLLRADSAARATYLAQMTQNGLMTRDEGRAYDNREPHGGNAAELTVQSNLVPIDKLGTQSGLTPVEAVQKAYLGVGRLITSDEARTLVNLTGAGLKVPGPEFDISQPTNDGVSNG